LFSEQRTLTSAYVPVNDKKGGILANGRQARDFRKTRPRDEFVYFVWEDEAPNDVRVTLDRLCRKVTRIGHSSSAVQMWVVPAGERPEPNWIPSEDDADMQARVTSAGTLRVLAAAFNGPAIQEYDTLSESLLAATGRLKAQIKKKLQERFPTGRPESRRPHLTSWRGYARAGKQKESEAPYDGPFEESFIVLGKEDGPVLALESTLQLTTALRNAAMAAAGGRPPEWLSGHKQYGTPSDREHAAFFPLPYVGFEHSDGHVMGLGIAIPRTLHNTGAERDKELRQYLGRLLFDSDTGDERQIRIWNTRRGRPVWEWTLSREKREHPPASLQRTAWTRASRRWASVTPVVLHHHPKRRNGDVERIVSEAFISALLLQPEELRLSSVSRVSGAGHALAVPPFTEGGSNLCRYQTHVEVRFDRPVRGPVLVGRGRFRGYGLFRPLDNGANE
jgi:CRISPR-associated protein Csb2